MYFNCIFWMMYGIVLFLRKNDRLKKTRIEEFTTNSNLGQML